MLFGVSQLENNSSAGESVRRDAREESWRARVRSHTFARQHHVAFARGEARAREETRARVEKRRPRDSNRVTPPRPRAFPRVNRASRRVPCAEPPTLPHEHPHDHARPLPRRLQARARRPFRSRRARFRHVVVRAMLAAQLPSDARVRDVRSGPRPRPGDETTRQHGLERPGPRDRGRGSERPRGMDRTFPPRSLELARSPERLPRRFRPRRRRQVRRARAPPRNPPLARVDPPRLRPAPRETARRPPPRPRTSPRGAWRTTPY